MRTLGSRVTFTHYPERLGSAGFSKLGFREDGREVAPPFPDARRAPSFTASPGARDRGERPAQVRPGLGQSPEGALSRPRRVPTAFPPRESESVAPRRSRIGGGAGADPGAGAGHSRGHGWAR